jgi:hypothetical protein
MTETNPINPEMRKTLAEAIKQDNDGDGRVKLCPSRFDDRPCMVQVHDGRFGAFCTSTVRDMGLEISGVTVMDGYTNVHLEEQ